MAGIPLWTARHQRSRRTPAREPTPASNETAGALRSRNGAPSPTDWLLAAAGRAAWAQAAGSALNFAPPVAESLQRYHSRCPNDGRARCDSQVNRLLEDGRLPSPRRWVHRFDTVQRIPKLPPQISPAPLSPFYPLRSLFHLTTHLSEVPLHDPEEF